MSYPFDTNDMAFPALDSVLETVQNQFWWGRNEQQTFLSVPFSGAARDAGNTVTDVLRGGLLMGRVTATGLYKEWNPTGTDGSEVIIGILPAPMKMTEAGSNADRWGYLMVGGNLYSDRLYVPGQAAEGLVGQAQEFNVVNQLVDRGFKLDKHLQYGSPNNFRPRYLTAAEIAADAVTVTTADHGRTFDLSSADATTTVTLPAAKVGLTFTVVSSAAQTTTIALASGTIVLPGNAAATGVSLTTGESARFVGIAAGVYYMMGCESTD